VCVCVWLWDLQAKGNASCFKCSDWALGRQSFVLGGWEVGFSALLYLMAQVGIKWPLHRTKGTLIKIKQWRETSKVSEQSGRGLSIFYSSVYLSNILSTSFVLQCHKRGEKRNVHGFVGHHREKYSGLPALQIRDLCRGMITLSDITFFPKVYRKDSNIL